MEKLNDNFFEDNELDLDIDYEALDKMSGLFEHLVEFWGPDATDEELEEVGLVEDAIYQFVRRNEPREGF